MACPEDRTSFNVSCPGGLYVHADRGGPVYINGKETTLKKSNDSYYEAKGSGVLMAYGCTVLYNDIGLRTQKGASCSADDLKQAEKAMTAHLSVN